MLNIMKSSSAGKKIVKSLLTLSLVAFAVAAATGAFFSDTETSKDNILQAGAIDLKIDNESYYNGEPSENTSWELKDLTVEKFFNFEDLKPGDWGEDTVSLHVNSNEAYVCVNFDITANNDNGINEPEDETDGIMDEKDTTPGVGDLADELNFFFWVDVDGGNDFDEGEDTPLMEGKASELLTGATYALADANGNKLDPDYKGLQPDETYHIAKVWCFGEWVPVGDQPVGAPIFDDQYCDGSLVSNLSQTDLLMGDISFYAVQTRHNEEFVCSNDLFPEVGNTQVLKLENKDDAWMPVIDGMYGWLKFAKSSPTFDYTLEVHGLVASADYELIYYADPWPGTGGMTIDTFTTDGSGNWSGSNSVELSTDLPVAGDTNPAAKLWVVPSGDWDGTQMTGWNPDQYLFEMDKITYDDSEV